MIEVSSIIEVAMKTFHATVDKLSYGDPAVKSIVSIFLLGLVGVASRLVLKRYPLLIWRWIKQKLVMSLTIIDDDTESARNFHRFMAFFEKKKSNRSSRVFRLYVQRNKTIVGPGSGWHWFFFKGRFFWFHVTEMDSSGAEKQKSKTVIFTYGFSSEIIHDFVDQFSLKPSGKLGLYVQNDNYSRDAWTRDSDLQTLTLDDLILPEETVTKLKSQIDWFMNNEAWYRERFLDYKLVIMLEGPPGTGKSYLSRAIAHYIHRDIFSLALGDSDGKFRKCYCSIPDNGMGLVEDFDDTKSMLKRQQDETVGKHEVEVRGNGIKLSTFLNALQGVNSSSGKVTVLTTNHLEVLDPAIYRAGRVDLMIHVGPLEHSLIVKYAAKMYSPEQAATIDYIFTPKTASLLGEIFKTHPHDFDGFIKALKEKEQSNVIELKA